MQSKRLELVVLRFHPGAHSVGNCASCLCLCYKGDLDFKRKFIFDFHSKLFELTEFILASTSVTRGQPNIPPTELISSLVLAFCCLPFKIKILTKLIANNFLAKTNLNGFYICSLNVDLSILCILSDS